MNTDQKIIKNKVGLLNLAEMLGSVSEACKVMGYSRDSFYRFKEGRSRRPKLWQIDCCGSLCGFIESA